MCMQLFCLIGHLPYSFDYLDKARFYTPEAKALPTIPTIIIIKF